MKEGQEKSIYYCSENRSDVCKHLNIGTQFNHSIIRSPSSTESVLNQLIRMRNVHRNPNRKYELYKLEARPMLRRNYSRAMIGNDGAASSSGDDVYNFCRNVNRDEETSLRGKLELSV